MDISVQLLFDKSSTSALRDVWSSLAEVSGSRTLVDGSYDPHITLALFKNLEFSAFSSQLRDLAQQVDRFELTFGHVGQFPGTECTLFLAPVNNPSLSNIHRAVISICNGLGGHLAQSEYSSTDRWVPHCSVAWRTDREAILRDLNVLLDRGIPANAIVDRLHLVHTPDDQSLTRIPFDNS